MLPKPVYEALPLCYIAISIVTILFALESISTVLYGALLGIAGICILVQRRKYRTSRCDYPFSSTQPH
ncbi:MAG: hypothetical protein OQK73_11090 [Gammaproteobacteria bacterium]|nr:hypothetical protein [Gammaproteobacteria bacterium]